MLKLKHIFTKINIFSLDRKNIIISVVFFYVGFFFFVFIFSHYSILTQIIQSLATLSAAFFGAWFAFSLQSKSKKKEEIDNYISASNRTIFTLYQRINNLAVYKKQFIDPFRGHPAIFLVLRPSNSFEKDDTIINLNTLDFLINHNYPQLLAELHIEDQRYKTAIGCINLHFKLHDQIQPLLEKAGLKEGEDYDLDFFEKALGQRLYCTLKRAVEELIFNVEETIKTSIDVKKRFRESLKSIFSDKKFMDFELPEKKV
ncbi:MAG: hypothetical protein ACLPSL_00725 [Smithella sp.]